MARILAVDDSQTMRDMVSYTLEEAGHEVVTAVDGVDALAIAQDESFDVVLADVNMPKMDGITLVGKLRAMEQFKYTPILMITTESAAERKQEARQAGATGWFVKPFDPEQLLATIRKVTG